MCVQSAAKLEQWRTALHVAGATVALQEAAVVAADAAKRCGREAAASPRAATLSWPTAVASPSKVARPLSSSQWRTLARAAATSPTHPRSTSPPPSPPSPPSPRSDFEALARLGRTASTSTLDARRLSMRIASDSELDLPHSGPLSAACASPASTFSDIRGRHISAGSRHGMHLRAVTPDMLRAAAAGDTQAMARCGLLSGTAAATAPPASSDHPDEPASPRPAAALVAADSEAADAECPTRDRGGGPRAPAHLRKLSTIVDCPVCDDTDTPSAAASASWSGAGTHAAIASPPHYSPSPVSTSAHPASPCLLSLRALHELALTCLPPPAPADGDGGATAAWRVLPLAQEGAARGLVGAGLSVGEEVVAVMVTADARMHVLSAQARTGACLELTTRGAPRLPVHGWASSASVSSRGVPQLVLCGGVGAAATRGGIRTDATPPDEAVYVLEQRAAGGEWSWHEVRLAGGEADPCARAYHTLTALQDDTFLLHGGLSLHSGALLADSHILDLRAGTWRPVRLEGTGVAAAGHGTVVVHGRMLVSRLAVVCTASLAHMTHALRRCSGACGLEPQRVTCGSYACRRRGGEQLAQQLAVNGLQSPPWGPRHRLACCMHAVQLATSCWSMVALMRQPVVHATRMTCSRCMCPAARGHGARRCPPQCALWSVCFPFC